jgi:regulator of protease activity HflC (stomatin/prohibitin superfamily)
MSAVLFAAVALAGCSQIDTGNVGVVTSFGKTSAEELPQGVHMTWFASVGEFTAKEVAMPLNDLKPKAKDNLTITDLDVDIYFQPNPGMVADTTIKYKGDAAKYEGDLLAGYNKVSREARESVYKAAAEFPATIMHTKRTELSALIQKTLQAELNASDKGVWTITSVNIRNLVTDPGIEASIRQAAETDQAINRMNKEKTLAIAEAEKAREIAKGQADANEIVARSLTPQLIRLREIESQTAFAKAGTHTVLMGGSSNALINVK